ncbi:folate-binding protein YgfZ [Paralimibaculum aggregatum]|uniref:Folate-binding protein YgfZ n=1 Tax=Paralimibaculum aggregatum TaxID=3036245 RepID=A0ABQ6LQB9_9RHOB|nr:folate-binding protein [Limibaculum sp. NKW23]GMG84926.1 folate-binding protein YgfZ [Limibaculum sp. NKW23]
MSQELPDGTGGLIGCAAPWRACLVMEGRDARAVLQGVVTSDVGRLAPGRLVYAALLTPQGKYLFDFFLGLHGDGAVRIEAAADRVEALAKRLSMYCLRRDARVVAAPALQVALLWPDAGAGAPSRQGAARPPTPAPRPEGAPAPAAPGAEVLADPRDPGLGWRVHSGDAAAALAALAAAPGDRAGHDALRVALAVPESGVELVPEESFILEAGLDRLGGVDFRKGCYVGQEVTARMKHKTELRKGLVPVRVEGAAPPGTPLLTAEGKPAGTLFTQAGGRGLAHLRFDRADGELRAGEARVTREG